jgi:ATP-dependent DNA helicase RecG
MPLQGKDDAMRRFKNGDIDILVSTAVIEVGIDVPNATVMVIDGAERFGLAQLHQFRGRVGRGAHKSHCILMSETASQESGKRLKILCDTSDGFRIAEEDLKLRGPGEYVGTRQSGLPELRVASVYDHDIIDIARREALRLIADDPDLSKPEHRPLRTRFQRYVSNSGMETS